MITFNTRLSYPTLNEMSSPDRVESKKESLEVVKKDSVDNVATEKSKE